MADKKGYKEKPVWEWTDEDRAEYTRSLRADTGKRYSKPAYEEPTKEEIDNYLKEARLEKGKRYCDENGNLKSRKEFVAQMKKDEKDMKSHAKKNGIKFKIEKPRKLTKEEKALGKRLKKAEKELKELLKNQSKIDESVNDGIVADSLDDLVNKMKQKGEM